METNIKIFSYENVAIEFDLSENKLMINATEMAKPFKAQINEFTSNDKTKSFIFACLKNGNSRFLEVEKEEDLIISKQKSGTWMHRILALKFAAWLSPDFELWVYKTIDSILFAQYRLTEESLKKTAERKKRMEELKEELRARSDDFKELERLILEEKQAVYSRTKHTQTQLELFMGEN